MTPIKLVRYKPTNLEIEVYSKCYEYESSSLKVAIIIIVIIIIVLIVITSIYCFFHRKDAKVKPHQKIETLKNT